MSLSFFTTDHPLNAGYTKQKRLLKFPPPTIGVQNNRVFCNALTDFGSLEYQQKPSMELETRYVHVLLVGDFVVLSLEWILNLEASQQSLQHVIKTEIQN